MPPKEGWSRQGRWLDDPSCFPSRDSDRCRGNLDSSGAISTDVERFWPFRANFGRSRQAHLALQPKSTGPLPVAPSGPPVLLAAQSAGCTVSFRNWSPECRRSSPSMKFAEGRRKLPLPGARVRVCHSCRGVVWSNAGVVSKLPQGSVGL